MKQYAVYKGEAILAMGTAKECAKELNVKTGTVLHYGTPTYKNRTTDSNGRRLVNLEENEE